jgi:phage tail sheath protein FI
MARSTYLAPGVYVEEIPSARQPIAGVGTNTVGFIGLVPPIIHIPVPNDEYDPVLAQHILDFKQLTAGGQDVAAQRQSLQTNLDSTQVQLRQAEELVATLTENRDTSRATEQQMEAALQTATEDTRAAAERAHRRAQTALTQAERELNAATERRGILAAERDQLQRLLAAPAPPPAPGAPAAPAPGAPAAPAPGAPAAPPPGVEVEDDTYVDTPPDSGSPLLNPSSFRPYYLEPFTVNVDEYDTKLCTNFSEYTTRFGDFSAFKDTAENPNDDPSKWTFKPLYPGHHLLTHAVKGFFDNGGTSCFVARIENIAHLDKVLDAFASIDDVAILAAPGLPKMAQVWEPLEDYCENDAHQNVFAILDLPAVINSTRDNDLDVERLQYNAPDPLLPRRSTHAACYAPFIEVIDPAKLLQDSDPARQVAARYRGLTYVAPSGHVAGIYARTDEERGVHKAPANATVRGAVEVKYYISRPKQELLNPQGVNCIRLLNGDVTVWGARTIGGDRNTEWKYVSVRRFAGFLEESIERGTQWVVFEPNDPNLWSRIILNITAFLTILWHNGALFGLTAQEAFYVKCDEELNPPEVRDLGMVITEIGVAIVRPAEFVIFRITQSTGPRQG